MKIARGRWEAQEITTAAPERSSGRKWAITVGLLLAAGVSVYVLWPKPEPPPAPAPPAEIPTA